MKEAVMIYQNYQVVADLSDPIRKFAEHARDISLTWFDGKRITPLQRMAAYYEQVALLGFTHVRPEFNIVPVMNAKGVAVPVLESKVYGTPFCDLVCFKREDAVDLPKVLLVAPMSGHFATLLRGTVQTLVQDHEVYLTDWRNIRDIPMSEGVFGLDEYIEHIIWFMQHLGPNAHLMGVCQPTVACLAATAVMAEDRSDCQPASLTLMAGPIDTRVNPTQVNELAMTKPIEWFEQNLVGMVPLHFKGVGRRVYPGFMQLMAFLNMNMDRHRQSFKTLYEHRVNGEDEKADLIRDFYKEYFAIMDLSGPFYLETVKHVFQDHLLPKGLLTYKGRPLNMKAIRKTFLLTVEGERDDICGMGQTLAAQDLCSLLPDYRKTHHLQAGVGHYGVFNGKRWDAQIYPVVRNMIRSAH
jgi:poly(3-hydroxybutyrate) depolymerase